MTNEEMIKALAEQTPKYAYNCKDFIPGKSQVLYSGPYWDHNEIEVAIKALIDGKWLTSGEQVAKFQWAFAHKFKVKFAHMTNSGSSANLLLISAAKKRLGWKDGDEVIVSPVGFPTTIAPLVQNGLKPVFVDIEWETLNFDLDQVKEKINERTRAIFVSPVLGNPPHMDRLLSFLDYNPQMVLLGDNCDSLGSTWNKKLITEYYYAWSCSFYPAHHISTGEGGMVCSNDEELIKLARSFSWWGRDCRCVGAANLLVCGTCGERFKEWIPGEGVMDHKYLFTNIGYNLKPLDLQGAIGLEQLKKVDEIDRKRRDHYHRWRYLLSAFPDIRVVGRHPEATPSWFGVPLVCEADYKKQFVQYLEDMKIQTRNYFAGNILLHPGYQHLGNATDYPNACAVMRNVFFVGCPPHYTEEVFQYISDVLSKWKFEQIGENHA